MSNLRTSLALSFALLALLSIWAGAAFWLEYRHTYSLHITLIVLALPAIFVIVFGAASWTILKDRASAEKWGIAASLLAVLQCLPEFYRGFKGLSDPFWIVFAIGIIGLVAFSRRTVRGHHAVKLAAPEPATGDEISAAGPRLDE